ncbi:class I SAM-dependent methyltransferase [soil metagenome]
MKEFELSKQSYIEKHDASLVFGLKHDDFRLQKKTWVESIISKLHPEHFLDFGFGTGELLEDLYQSIGGPMLSGVDPSDLLREEFVSKNQTAALYRIEASLLNFDDSSINMITCFNVLHHIPPEERTRVARQIAKKLSPSGVLLVWEHNPLNPGTQIVVCRCEYDRDAVLLRRSEVEKLFFDLKLDSGEYLNFTPPSLQRLKFFKKMESYLSSVPLGAQYRLVLRKET